METCVIFTNNDGQYYLETVSSADTEKIRQEWDIQKEMDNKNWEEVMFELNNPSIEDGKQLAVFEYCYE